MTRSRYVIIYRWYVFEDWLILLKQIGIKICKKDLTLQKNGNIIIGFDTVIKTLYLLIVHSYPKIIFLNSGG